MSSIPRQSDTVIRILDEPPAPLTREQIGQLARLSRPTVARVISGLEQAGYVVPAREAEHQWFPEVSSATPPENGNRTSAGPGRPPLAYRLTKAAGVVIGIDIGHRGIRCAIADSGGEVLQTGDKFAAERVNVDKLGPNALLRAVEIARGLAEKAGIGVKQIRGVAIGLPAPVRNDGRIGGASYLPGWNEVNANRRAVAIVDQYFPGREWKNRVFVDNDANLGALGEATWGTASWHTNVLYVKVSSGIGAGLVIGGRIYHGGRGLAGEFGHVSVSRRATSPQLIAASSPAATVLVYCPRCGKPDCLEVQASGDALMREAALRSTAHADLASMIERIKADPMRFADDNAALATAGELIGFAIAQATVLLDPDIVVLGGVMADAGERILEPIQMAARRNGVGFEDIPIKLVENRPTVGVRGAAALALQQTAPVPVRS